MEALERRDLPAATPLVVVESEPNNLPGTADAVAFDTSNEVQIQGNSTNRDDSDRFAFTAPSNGSLALQVTSSNGVPLRVRLFDAAGEKIIDQTTSGPYSAAVDLVSGEDYQLEILNRGRRVAAPYLVDLVLTPDAGGEPANELSESEPNDRKSAADRFALGSDGLIQLLGSAGGRDRDYFVFTAQANGTLQVDVQSSGAAAKVQIEDAAGNDLAETQPNDGVHSFSLSVVAGQTYYLRARSARPFGIANYTIQVALTPDAVS